MDGFSYEVLSRLPLADAVLSLCSFAMDADFLLEIFDAHRGRSYEDVLTFPTMVNVVGDALLEHEGSGRQAIVRAQEREELEATKQAVYGKLRRIPISLSNGFLARTTDRLRDVFPQQAACRLPASLRQLDVVVIDGKKIKRAAKRLKAARGYSGTPVVETAPGITLGDSSEALRLENQVLREQLGLLDVQQQATQQALSEMRQRLDASAFALGNTSAPPGAPIPQMGPAIVGPCPPETASSATQSLFEGLGTRYDNGFVLVETSDQNRIPYRLQFNLFNQFRYLNQQLDSSTFTDHLGNVRTVEARNDFNVNRNLFYFNGYVFDPKFIFNIIIWSSNSVATVVQGGYIGYAFDKCFTLYAGYYGIPGSRSNTRDFMFLQGVERSMADSFFRPAFTQGVWAEGQLFEHVFYYAWVGNSLNTLNVSTTKIDRNFVYAANAWWEPLGDYGPPGAARMAYSDLEHYESPVVRLGTSLTGAREDRFSNLDQTKPENSAIFNSDGVLFFENGSLAPGVTVQFADYVMWAQDAGIKYRGLALNAQYFLRWLDDFSADGPLPISDTFDHGYEASLGYFIVPRTFELYGRSSAVFGQFGDSNEYAFGFNWHPWQNRGFRLIGEANRVHNSPTSSIQTIYNAGMDGWNFVLQTGLYF